MLGLSNITATAVLLDAGLVPNRQRPAGAGRRVRKPRGSVRAVRRKPHAVSSLTIEVRCRVPVMPAGLLRSVCLPCQLVCSLCVPVTSLHVMHRHVVGPELLYIR